MNRAKLVDALRKRCNIKSDAALARELELRPPDVCKIRGGGAVTDRVILRIHEYLSIPVNEIRQMGA